jgi:hypothetical protein
MGSGRPELEQRSVDGAHVVGVQDVALGRCAQSVKR